jgi:hypothetical protein
VGDRLNCPAAGYNWPLPEKAHDFRLPKFHPLSLVPLLWLTAGNWGAGLPVLRIFLEKMQTMEYCCDMN